MAKQNKGIFGGIKGSIGNVYGYQRLGKQIIAAQPEIENANANTFRVEQALSVKHVELMESFMNGGLRNQWFQDSLLFGEGIRGRQLNMLYQLKKRNSSTWHGINWQSPNSFRGNFEILDYNDQSRWLTLRFLNFTADDILRGHNAFLVRFTGKGLQNQGSPVIVNPVPNQVYQMQRSFGHYGKPFILIIAPFNTIRPGSYLWDCYYPYNGFFKPSLLY